MIGKSRGQHDPGQQIHGLPKGICRAQTRQLQVMHADMRVPLQSTAIHRITQRTCIQVTCSPEE